MRAWLALVLLCGCDQVFGLERPPPEPLAPGTWAQIATGEAHACGIRLDGSLWCWGRNESGQLGLGPGAIEQAAPVQVGSARWKAVSTRVGTTCGIQVDGSLWCWGNNTEGAIADGTTFDRFEPTRVGSATWLAVAVGRKHVCALAADATAWCWGGNMFAQLGVGDALPHTGPTAVSSSSTWTALVAGADHTCAIASDQTVSCWGDNSSGQLGSGSRQYLGVTPQRVSDQVWSAVGAGSSHTCGILGDGRLRCWGTNSAGQLGIVGPNGSPSPTALDGDDDDDWAPIVAGGAGQSCAAKIDGSLWCWGDNDHGQTGGARFTTYDPAPHRVLGGAASWVQLAAAGPTCGIGDDHNLWCLALGSSAEATIRTPARVPGSWKVVSGGSVATCAIDDTTALFCWGTNYAGQLGNGSYQTAAAPLQIADPGWVSVATSPQSGCALRQGGALSCWGSTQFSLGDGSAIRLVPTAISNRAWTSVTVGYSQTCAIEASTGQLYCWGSNSNGELGTGDNTSLLVPTPITTQVWTAISAGSSYTCGVGSAGLQCWGDNGFGQLGDGSSTAHALPMPIGAANTVAAGSTHTCAIAGTKLSCWGNNALGQIGDGMTGASYVPVPLDGDWLSVSIGSEHSCAIKMDHSLWCWGYNQSGQVGDGSTEVLRAVPTQVGDDATWQSVTAGAYYSCAIKADGSLWCWGDNTYSQLGLGTLPQSTPNLIL